MKLPDTNFPDTNEVVLAGRITADPIATELKSGSVVYAWSLNVAPGGEPATSVPVVVFDPPAAVRTRGAGDAVVVTGQVKRRFFRAAGITQSRTEVVAATIVPVTSKKRVAAALAPAVRALDRLNGAPGEEP